MKKVSTKIIVLALAVVVITGLGGALSSTLSFIKFSDGNLAILEKSLRENYDHKAKNLVEVAHSMLTALMKKVDSGVYTIDEAKVLGADLLRDLRYEKDLYFWADTSEGINVVLLGRETEGKTRWETQDTKGLFLVQEVIKNGLKEGGGFTDYWFPRASGGESFKKRGYSLHFKSFDWIIGTGNYIDDIEKEISGYRLAAQDQMISSLIGYLINVMVCIVVAIGLALWFGRRISKPLIQVSQALAVLSQGEADLTKTLPVMTKDEVGILAQSFNGFVKKLDTLVGTVRMSMEKLGQSGQELASNSTETAAAVYEIASNVESVKNLVIHQSASITETSATVEQINKNVAGFHQMIQTQSREVEASSQSIHAMVSEMSGVSAQVDQSAQLFRTLQDESVDGRAKMEEVIAAVQDISAKSESLLETNEVISAIASQTNLLAMNAAIEAAHAGEAGKGFAVVADEIRKLAESASFQAKETSGVLKGIKEMIDRVSQASGASGAVFGIIMDQIAKVAQVQTQVQQTLITQAQGNEKVLEMYKGISQLSTEIRTGSDEMAQGTRTILDEMNRLVGISQQVQDSMGEIARGTQEINLAVNGISNQSVVTEEAISAVKRETSRFTVSE